MPKQIGATVYHLFLIIKLVKNEAKSATDVQNCHIQIVTLVHLFTYLQYKVFVSYLQSTKTFTLTPSPTLLLLLSIE